MNEGRYYVNSTAYPIQSVYNENISESQKMGNYVAAVPPSTAMEAFDEWYKPIHGYLASFVCIFGVVANVLNIIVLTRKNMISSTNIILTGLALADALTMAFYFPFGLQMYVIHGTNVSPVRDTQSAAKFQLSYAILSVIVHSIAIWLTVTLAVFRYVFIRFPRRGAIYCNVQRAKMAVVAVAIVVSIVCIPNAITYEIRSETAAVIMGIPNATDERIYWVDVKKNTTSEIALQKFNFWVQAILVKLLPCLLLTIFSFLLVRTMQGAEKRRKIMMNKNSVVDGEAQPVGNSGGKRSKRSVRTTRMLLTVVILFLITETPQGIMSLLNGLIEDFFHNVYTPLGDLLDILALTNNGINFVLYCTMSKQFRDTFIAIFCCCFPKLMDGRKFQTVTTMAVTRDSEV